MKYSYLVALNYSKILSLVCIVNTAVYSQSSFLIHGFEKSLLQANNLFQLRQTSEQSAASSWFDVTYYRLELNVLTQPNFLKGKVTIAGICQKDNVRTLTLDLVNQMRVDSVLIDGSVNLFTQYSTSFEIVLPRSYSINEVLSVEVFYEGLPIPTGFGSFIFDSYGGIPWVYSLSQPYGAKDWWSCKDDPSDKADSADIIVTCDSTFKVGSQGILVSVNNNGDGTSTHHWKERYPIASYLISVAITNYFQFSNWFKYSDTDSMEVLNYVLPEHYTLALETLPRTIDMLSIFSDLFGLYPFIKEKYGHAEFGRGGAMEHQTMTSTTTFNEDVLAHELAHQWFGNMITCCTWADLWLNEGFAQYSTALYREQRYGINSYWEYMNSQLDQAKLAQGAIGIPDTTSVRNLFNSHRIYSKGACVLHMLRRVLGDSVFFRCLYTYANDAALKYSTAVIGDFQSVCENVSGKNLQYFFHQWIYGEGLPEYNYAWKWKSDGNSSVIILDIEQAVGRNTPSYFTMPIDIRIESAGQDTTITVLNNAQRQRFLINYSVKPSAVVLDSEGWILKYAYSENDQIPLKYILEQNYPNPFNSATTIAYMLPKREHVSLKLYDILGREITTLVDAKQSAGYYEYQWNPQKRASGVYFYQLVAGSVRLQKKMVLLQ